MTHLTRRSVLRASAIAAPSAFFIGRSRTAQAAPEFRYKLATATPTSHPSSVRLKEAADNIQKATDGRVVIDIFPNAALGSEIDIVNQVRSGAIQFMLNGSALFSSINASAGATGIGFAFKNYSQIWAAIDDGPLGVELRKVLESLRLHALDKVWDNGVRQFSNSAHPILTPDDMKGLKIRSPNSPIYLSLISGLGAGPVPLTVPELYPGMQTKIVDGQESPISAFAALKMYEVQKYVSITNHIWNDLWLVANPRAWQRLPSGVQEVVAAQFNASAVREREDIVNGDGPILKDIQTKGVQVSTPDLDPFRETLRKSGYYETWRTNLGATMWAALEGAVGRLA